MKKRIIRLLCIFVALTLVFVCAERILHLNTSFVPDYEMCDVAAIFQKETLTEDDYLTLFYQTGLSKYALDEMETDDILAFQKNFFKERNVDCVREAITTSMEYITDSNGNRISGFSLAPLHAGYVLIMESSHSFFWRHGHAGLVLDKNTVLEAPMIGSYSGGYSSEEWTHYPRFMMLRPKNMSNEDMSVLAGNARRQLGGLPYSPFAGIFDKKISVPKTTQCAHLVWCAYKNAGYDIDSSGGKIVTVQDIINSDLFDIVQIYGYDPADFAEKAKTACKN